MGKLFLPFETGSVHPVMTDDLDAIALRPTVIGGVRQDDDYEVVWRGLPVGRMMKQADSPHWWWGCNVYGLPATPNDRGPAINYKDCQVRFRLAWARIRPTLTEETIRSQRGTPKGCRSNSRRRTSRRARTASGSGEQSRSAPATGIEVRIHRVQWRRHRLHHPECFGHRRRLEVASPVGVPESFWLVVSGDHTRRHCRVAWRKDKRIGVAFDRPHFNALRSPGWPDDRIRFQFRQRRISGRRIVLLGRDASGGHAMLLIGVASHQAIGLLYGGLIHRGSRTGRCEQQKYQDHAAQHRLHLFPKP